MAKVEFPPGVEGNGRAMALWARALYSSGKHRQAFDAALAATERDPLDDEVRQLVSSLLSIGASTYHVPMLRDDPRNRCYREALVRAIRPGMTVLEIGTGGGLLSLIAAKAGARVVTCERQPILAAAATVIAERNGLSDRITVIPKTSGQLEIGNDLAEPADMLMSELFDDTLFGDDIVDIIGDARRRLLKADAPIVPPRAELRCALVETDVPQSRAPLAEVEGFDMSPLNLLAPPSAQWLRWSSKTVRRSNAFSALAKDFRSAAPFGPDVQTIALHSSGGRVNGVVQWLRIDFGDGIVFENDPFVDSSSHWGSPIHLLSSPIETGSGDPVRVKVQRIDSDVMISLDQGSTA